jgi:hypothetical protein
MTYEELQTRQNREILEYRESRVRRLEKLQNDQAELFRLCKEISPKGHTLLQQLLQDQQKMWQAIENDEQDMLSQIHTLERESFLEKQRAIECLNEVLSRHQNKQLDQGR